MLSKSKTCLEKIGAGASCASETLIGFGLAASIFAIMCIPNRVIHHLQRTDYCGMLFAAQHDAGSSRVNLIEYSFILEGRLSIDLLPPRLVAGPAGEEPVRKMQSRCRVVDAHIAHLVCSFII